MTKLRKQAPLLEPPASIADLLCGSSSCSFGGQDAQSNHGNVPLVTNGITFNRGLCLPSTGLSLGLAAFAPASHPAVRSAVAACLRQLATSLPAHRVGLIMSCCQASRALAQRSHAEGLLGQAACLAGLLAADALATMASRVGASAAATSGPGGDESGVGGAAVAPVGSFTANNCHFTGLSAGVGAPLFAGLTTPEGEGTGTFQAGTRCSAGASGLHGRETIFGAVDTAPTKPSFVPTAAALGLPAASSKMVG
ncbi:unnamed protein product [Protopolystoma xenopodis]|uniref:Uncharacterized protein n=1 Tax=Protopolystoma xenopodis TaxID=117903 RepID=A0A3S5FGH6_9PLAT|nr:unnamed protein product [Protopolystoma xenopodis]